MRLLSFYWRNASKELKLFFYIASVVFVAVVFTKTFSTCLPKWVTLALAILEPVSASCIAAFIFQFFIVHWKEQNDRVHMFFFNFSKYFTIDLSARMMIDYLVEGAQGVVTKGDHRIIATDEVKRTAMEFSKINWNQPKKFALEFNYNESMVDSSKTCQILIAANTFNSVEERVLINDLQTIIAEHGLSNPASLNNDLRCADFAIAMIRWYDRWWHAMKKAGQIAFIPTDYLPLMVND